MTGNEISEVARRRVIVDILYEGLTQRETAEKEHISLPTVNTIWQGFVAKTQADGLSQTLEKDDLLDAVELAKLAKAMKKTGITPTDCFRALPLAGKFKGLKLDPEKIWDIVDAAVKLKTPEFPVEEYADAIARIYRREKESGLGIESIEATYNNLTVEVQRRRVEETELQSRIAPLKSQELQLNQTIQSKQLQLDAIEDRLAKAGQTDEALRRYELDRNYMHGVVGVDLSNVGKARAFFEEMLKLGYDPRFVAGLILNTPTLSTMVQNLGDELQSRAEKADGLNKTIIDLESKRAQAERDEEEAERRARVAEAEAAARIQASKDLVQRAEADANARIEESNKRVEKKLAEEEMTLQDIEDTKLFRIELRQAGIKT